MHTHSRAHSADSHTRPRRRSERGIRRAPIDGRTRAAAATESNHLHVADPDVGEGRAVAAV